MATTSTVDTSLWGLYVHQAKNGTLTVVDSAGKPVASPPSVKLSANGNLILVNSSGVPVLGSDNAPITLPSYSPPTHNIFAYTASDGTVTIVDSAGKPVPTPPFTEESPAGGLVIVDASGKIVEGVGGPVEIPAYSPPTANVFLYSVPGETPIVVDAAGNPVASPPNVVTDPTTNQPVFADSSGNLLLDSSGQPMAATEYSPPMTDIYVYRPPGGYPIVVVDAAGNPVASPPNVVTDPTTNQPVFADSSGNLLLDSNGQPTAVSEYSPPATPIYLHTAADGTVTAVDATGNPIPSPPMWAFDPVSGQYAVLTETARQQQLDGFGGTDEESFARNAGGKAILVLPYSPATSNVYLYIGADGTSTVVDATGKPVSIPPLWKDMGTGPVVVGSDYEPVLDTNGSPISIPAYDPSGTPRLLVYVAPDGTPEVVDANGQPVTSPPTVAIHPGTGEPALVDAKGQFLLDSTGNPTTLPVYSPPTQGLYAYVSTNPATGAVDVQIVDGAGNLVQSPPGYKLVSSADPSDPPSVVFVGVNGQPLTDTNGNQLSPPLYSPPTQGVYAHVLTDPVTGAVDVRIVDGAGNLVQSPPGYKLMPAADPSSDPPTVVLTDANGKPLTDLGGKAVPVPVFSPPTEGVYAHVLRDPVSGAVDVQIVDSAGNLVPSPPGYLVKQSSDPSDPPTVVFTDANGKPIADSNGNQLSPPFYSPPTQGVYAHVLRDPVTGAVDVQIVDAAGNLVQSPPGYKLIPAADPSDPPSVVFVGANGQPLTDTNGNQLSPPSYSPPTQGIYAHVVTNPATGEMDVQLVDAAGNLVPSPPGYIVQKGSDPSDPPTIVLTGTDGKPLTDQDGNPISVPMDSSSSTPPGTSPPANEEADGTADVLDQVETATEEESERGVREPADEIEPGSQEEVPDVREEIATETPAEEASDVEHRSTEAAGGEAAADRGSRTGEAIVEEEEPTSRGTGEGPIAEIQDLPAGVEPVEVPEIEGKATPVPEPEAVEFKVESTPIEVETAGLRVDAVAEDKSEFEERSADVESDVARVDTPEEVATLPINLPEMPGELTPVDPLPEVGVVGLGADDLLEMVTGRDAPSVEVGHAGGDSELPGEPVAAIPDLPLARELIEEVEIESKIAPVPEPEPVEFKVEAVPADAEPVEVRVEPAIGGAPAEPAVDPGVFEEVEPDAVRATPMEDKSPVGLGVEEIVEMATGREEAAAEGAIRPPDMEPLVEEPVLEIPELSVAEVVEVAEVLETESKITPPPEAETVEFKFFRPQDEIDTSEFRVEVSEAGSLEIDEEVSEGLTRYVEEPEEEPIWVSEEEEDDEEEQIQT